MTGLVGVKFRIMPSSPEANLEKIKEKSKKIIETNKGMRLQISEEPIAFGLKSVNLFFQFDEDSALTEIEESLQKIKEVQSVEMTDIRKIA